MTGYAFTGSFCTHSRSSEIFRELKNTGLDLVPILSETVYTTDTRFGKAERLIETLENISGRKCVHTIEEAEKFGPAMSGRSRKEASFSRGGFFKAVYVI